MLNSLYHSYKSGTDIRGVAVKLENGPDVNLTDEMISDFADGFVLRLSEMTKKAPTELHIAVGHDSRISAERIRKAVIDRLVRCGARVSNCSLSSTPAMFMTTVMLGTDGAVQITASHHPMERNGLKFFTRAGGFDSCDIEAVLQKAQDGEHPEKADGGSVTDVDFMSDYAAHLRKIIIDGVDIGDKPLEGFHIAVDAGNGAGGFFAEKVLAPLGADVSGSRYLEPDGRFPNHIPNPEEHEAIASICEAVKESGADLGVIFDTDVDRAGCVGPDGKEINRNRLIALASVMALESCPGGTIVTDSTTSDGLKTFIEKELGGVHHRFKRGYKNVINESVRLCEAGIDSPLAIETSGHAALRENYFLDDGAYLMTRVIVKAAKLRREGRTVCDLISGLREPAQSLEKRFKIDEKDFRAYGEAVLSELEKYAAAQDGWRVADDNRDGIRVSVPGGWFLLRLSVHDPIMPLNAESDLPGGASRILDEVTEYLSKFSSLSA